MLVQSSSKYVEYARQGLTAKQVAALTGCSRTTAKEALQRAHDDVLSRMGRNVQQAVNLFERSTLERPVTGAEGHPVMSRYRWEDVVAGIAGGN